MRIIIAGGGASGLFAAYTLAGCVFAETDRQRQPEIIVLEANSVFGKKILSTGNGRCNLCNTQSDVHKYYCEERSFVEAVLEQFSCQDAMREFEKMGVALKDKDGYIYPASMQAATVSNALVSACRLYGRWLLRPALHRCRVGRIRKRKPSTNDKDTCSVEKFCVETNRGMYYGDYVVMAYGSNAGLSTDHIAPLIENLKHLGHTVRPFRAALCSIYADMSEKYYRAFFKTAGGVRTEGAVSLVNNTVSAEDTGSAENTGLEMDTGSKNNTYYGELQLTEYGLSGIVVFQLSHLIADRLDEKKKPYPVVTIDFFPAYDPQTLCHLLTEQVFYEKRSLLELFAGLINRKLAQALLQLYAALRNKAIRPELKNTSSKELIAIIEFMKQTPFPICKTNDIAHAQVCSGGVPVHELHNTLASKRTEHLYFCGECIDVDGICGGYNLMWAWATGYIAAKSILIEIKETSDEST